MEIKERNKQVYIPPVLKYVTFRNIIYLRTVGVQHPTVGLVLLSGNVCRTIYDVQKGI
jgi:hypothetical protein